jgi:clan AA aspartic protease
MITGVVNVNGEAIIRMVVGNLSKKRVVVDAIIDTGYTGFLTLPPSTITELNLPWRGSEEGVLGDGSTQMFDVYSAEVIWDGEFRTVKINESNTNSLIGVGLLYGYEVCIKTVNRGIVTIKTLTE